MPRRDLLLDSDGNRLIVNGDYGFADNAQAVKQGIECRVKLFRGEYWLDISKGVRWIEVVLVRNPNETVINAELTAAILDTPDVTSAVELSFTRDTLHRTARVEYNVASTEGLVSGTVTQ